MKVNNKTGTPVRTDSTAATKTSLTGSTKKTKGVADIFSTELGSSARVDLSERAQDVKKAKEIAKKGLNDVDEAKVAHYQSLIDGGKYKVDAAKVADRMLEEHLSNELAAGETSE